MPVKVLKFETFFSAKKHFFRQIFFFFGKKTTKFRQKKKISAISAKKKNFGPDNGPDFSGGRVRVQDPTGSRVRTRTRYTTTEERGVKLC